MGCASSTPMITTAGSEMLKGVSHVADDAAKSAEDAVEDVTHTLGKSLETAKDSVGHTVTDIANDLGTALKEKTDMLDDAKNNLLGKLHLGGAEPSIEKKTATTAETEVAKEHVSKDSHGNDDADIKRTDEMPTRAPTPVHDVDSLKTSTPEPEIEQALANFMADSPPTPKPTFAELEKLTTEAVDKTSAALLQQAETLPQQVETTAQNALDMVVAKVSDAVTEAKPSEQNAPPVDLTKTERPGTTDWEKYADMLSTQRKFNPSDAIKRGKFKVMSDTKPPSVPHIPRTIELHHLGESTRSIIIPRPSPRNSHGQARANTALRRERTHSDSESNNYSVFDSNPSSLHSSHLDLQSLQSALSPASTKKIQNELASLAFLANISGIGRNSEATKAHSQAPSQAQSRAQSRAPSRAQSRAQSRAPSRDPSRAPSPVKSRSVSRSTNKSSNKSTPQLSRSSTMASLYGGGKNVIGTRSKIQTKIKAKQGPLPKLSRPTSTRDNNSHLKVDASAYLGRPRTPSRVMNTSSFLSSPRVSPFSIRKNYAELKEHESKHASGNHLTASPYKIRERCAVCYNKYVIK